MSWRQTLAGAVVGAALAASAFPALAADCCKSVAAPAGAVDDTIALPATTLADQRGRPVKLPDGRPWVLTFFYAGCPDVCPTLLYNVLDVAAALPPAARARIAFGGISFDPARDTVARLAEHAENLGFRAANEYLLTAEPATLAPALQAFKFDFKPDRNGGFQHTTLIAVMDGKGRILHHFYGLHPDTARIAGIVRDLAGGG